MGNVLELKDVCKDYGDFKLDHVSFEIPEGCICGFIGQNGAGKTTTIRLILDSVRRDGGDILVFGKDIRKEDCAIKEDIGVVYAEMGFHDFMSPKDINTMMKNIYKKWEEETFFEYLKRFSLPAKKKCGKFSRGMQMKLQIAVALSHGAKLLLMDEPTSGLDPIVRNEILQIFQEYVMDEERTVLLSSHITGDIERIADRVVFIDHGSIVLSGNKDEILEKHGILKCKKEEVEKLDAADCVSSRSYAYGTEVLVKDRELCASKYPHMVMDQCSLEEIMLFYVNSRNKEA